MEINRIVPIISINEVEKIKRFYLNTLGFKVVFDGKGYLGLKAPGSKGPEVSFMIPEAGQPCFNGAGLTYCFLVDDVNKEYKQLSEQGVTMLQPLRDNPWGDRSFIIADPIGVALYFYQEIPPTDEFKQYIVE